MNRGSSKKESIVILGAGLVGSLMALFLVKKSYDVRVYEKRADLRENIGGEGRSINLALSNRGWNALKEVQVVEEVKKFAMAMKGRIMHDKQGILTFQPYGKEGEVIYSVSRERLNKVLISAAENHGATFHFNYRCTEVDLIQNSVHFLDEFQGKNKSITADLIIGADGAFSTLRGAMQKRDRFSFSQQYIEYGYKELTIPPTDHSFALEPNALHIWPRKQYMLIALPNPDYTFTCTLFYPFEGKDSFASLNSGEKVFQFFKENFPDVTPLMPDLINNFQKNPTSSLLTIKCFPWAVEDKALLVGDAAHAILPFFGQGMNSGFEDCQILNSLIEQYSGNWRSVLENFQIHRKPDTDAIAELALLNFIEMRDLVADPQFLLRKKIEAKLNQLFPEQWIPLYSMITFSDIPYSVAKERGVCQDLVMDKVMKTPDIDIKWENLDFHVIINNYQQKLKAAEIDTK
ncbi:NAD(P)/FAD-dependent oxidoreductase [soil metagenome]